MKNLTGAFAMALFLSLAGCGMFGDTAFYTAIGVACMKCHTGGNVPTKQNLQPDNGMKGEAGSRIPGCPMDCPFAKGR